jgi:NAD(P)H-hydrate epimerase
VKITTAAEMRAIDRRAQDEFGIPSLALMQSAGEAFARACIDALGGSAKNKRVTLVCGRGNNGGDGFVAARHLAGAGAQVDVFLAGRADELKGDAAVYFAPLPRLSGSGVRVVPLAEADGATGVAKIVLSRYDLVGDALFGTGFTGVATGVAANLIEHMNTAQAGGLPLVSCDIPSGVNADTGEVAGPAVQATRTVTFALPKMGLLLYPGAALAGRITVAPIGIPRALLDDENLQAELTTHAWMQKTLPPRTQARDANKGAFGTVLVIAGGRGMAGAAVLAALAALRAGAGLVQLAVPARVFSAAAGLAPEIITQPLPETPDETHGGPGALEAALALAEKADAVALGPGLGRNKETTAFVQNIVNRLPKPLVVDADGLNALADDPKAAQSRTAPLVLTPHPGEMGRLLGTDTARVQADRVTAARDCATRYNAVTLLKGARTLIAEPANSRIAVNRGGSPALATAGSGDVLTGVIAALLGQKIKALDAARAGAYLHALAGERAAREMGVAGVIASDVLHRLPPARQSLYDTNIAAGEENQDDL